MGTGPLGEPPCRLARTLLERTLARRSTLSHRELPCERRRWAGLLGGAPHPGEGPRPTGRCPRSVPREGVQAEEGLEGLSWVGTEKNSLQKTEEVPQSCPRASGA